jgi:glyoxylase-like metal-dependent hydrolase (beta-lactamase superfamily II)
MSTRAFRPSLLGIPAAIAASLALALWALTTPAVAQGKAPPPQMKKVADDLYFWFDYRGTNSAIWITDDGVFVIDTQPHPVKARSLIGEIRKLTDKPVKWAFNSQVHGDHYLGNSEFKKLGATIIAQADAAFLMKNYFAKDVKRRTPGFVKAGLDIKELSMVLPDITFEKELVLTLGGKQVRLFYPGPGQDPGASYAHFPHAKALHTNGSFTTGSLSNLMFTPSVDGWIKVLREIQAMDIDVYVPGHGDLGKKSDVEASIGFLTTIQAKAKDAIARKVPLDEAQKTLTLDEFKSWRNYPRMRDYVSNMYTLLQSGKPPYWTDGFERK